MKQYAAYIAIDWADRKNVFALRAKNNERIEYGSFNQRSESIRDWVLALRKRFKGEKIAVILEQSKGGLIFSLMKYDFIVLYPINPFSLSKYRDIWSPSGAKDDPTDAALILDFFLSHYQKLKAWKPEPADIRLLQRLTEQRVKLLNDLKRVGNKLTSTLKEYFPQVLDLFPRIYRDIVADFLLTYPTLEAAKAASDEELLSFFRSRKTGAAALVQKRIAIIRDAVPLIDDSVIIESNAMFVQALARELKALNQSIELYEEQIEAVYERQPDKALIDSLPHAGEIMAPRLLAALGTDRSKFNSAEDLLAFSGIAPILERSGNQSWVHWRFRCSKPIRQAFIEWAFISMRSSFWAEAFYKQQRAKGKSHSVALRSLAYKWIRIIFRMWQNREPYSEARYLKALQKAGSPLMKGFQQENISINSGVSC